MSWTRDFQHVSSLAFEGRGLSGGRKVGRRDKKRAEIIAGVCEGERAASSVLVIGTSLCRNDCAGRQAGEPCLDISAVGLALILERIAPGCPTFDFHQTYPRNAQACGERTNSQEGVNGGREGGTEGVAAAPHSKHTRVRVTAAG